MLLLQLISSSRSKEYALLRYKLHKSRACETVVFVPHNAQYRRQMLSKQNSEWIIGGPFQDQAYYLSSCWLFFPLISRLSTIQQSYSHAGNDSFLFPTAIPLTWSENLWARERGILTQKENRLLYGS